MHISVLIAPIVLLASASALADDTATTGDATTVYEVELLVFTNPAATGATSPAAGVPGAQAATDAPAVAERMPPQGSGARSEPLRPDLLRFNGMRSRLERTPGHTVLLHYGWTQELPGERNANGVGLPSAAADHGLRGVVTAYRGRFLHLGVDLNLIAADGTRARMKQTRRVKAGTLQYFDNAQFGAIVVLRPAASNLGTAGAAPLN